MKELIMIICGVILALFLYTALVGPEDDSVKNEMGKVFESRIEYVNTKAR